MAATTMSPVSEKFIDKCNPDDPEYQRDLMRPVEIKEDVKLMEQRKRVSIILKSKTFCRELEDVIKRQCRHCGILDPSSSASSSLLSVNHISEQLQLAALPRRTTSAIGVGVSTNGIIPINDLRDGLNSYGGNERQLRCKVAALHRLMDMFSWCNGSQHYVTARLSKDQDRFLIKPFGIFFHEVTASCLITIDFKGLVKDPGSTVLSADESNWTFHAAIHMCRPEISCLIHLRTYAALCVSGSSKGLLPLSLEAVLLGDIGVFHPKSDLSDLESTGGFNNLRNELSQALAPNKKILILPNHGIFIGGTTVEETWFLVQRVQTACEVQEALYKLDIEELFLPDKETQKEMMNICQNVCNLENSEKSEDEKISEKLLHKYRVGQMEFEAMMRHLDNSGYRTGYFYQQKDIYKDSHTENGLSPVSKYPDVEIPPVCSSLTQSSNYYDDTTVPNEEFIQKNMSLQRGMSENLSRTWFNTPNTYKIDDRPESENLYDINQKLLSTPEHRQTRWISANPSEKASVIPHHPVTPGAHITILSASASSAPTTPSKVPLKGIDPKELKEKQKKVKDRYYFDTNTPGPQSCLLEGLTWEESRRVREEGLTKYLGKASGHGGEPLITAASKGIVQRGHKDRAVVLEGVFKPANPFEKVTDDDLVKYREEIDRKNHPELYIEPEIVTSKSETDLLTPVNVEAEMSMPPLSSISLDESMTNQINRQRDTGMTSDSDVPGDSSVALNSITAPSGTLQGTVTSETSAADLSHDDAEKDTNQPGKPKKKKLFKSLFGKKKKKKDEKK